MRAKKATSKSEAVDAGANGSDHGATTLLDGGFFDLRNSEKRVFRGSLEYQELLSARCTGEYGPLSTKGLG
jgi:hypothetical protein